MIKEISKKINKFLKMKNTVLEIKFKIDYPKD